MTATASPGVVRAVAAPTTATIDGNEACARVAYALNEVCAIYPITPSSTMSELADQWSSEGAPNLWGAIPEVIEMQSEGGAAGAVHGALQAGALTTTFTSSQGLLLMIPNMYKIAGELSSTVFHVAARSLAAQGLSIFGDHQDVMAVRATGFALLASGSVQEAHDFALIAQAASLESRVPFLHFFDGFRTSHEINRISLLSPEDLRALIDDELVLAHRRRALNPDRPFIRGTAQNPDVYFQARESVNPFYARTPSIVERVMADFARRTGRKYGVVEYSGDPNAERVVVLMGSGAGTVEETVEYLAARGEAVGMIRVRLFRPFPGAALAAAIPPTARSVAVLDRTKEPGSAGEPLYLDVVAALAEFVARSGVPRVRQTPRVAGGRYGLSSKEFTPAMVLAVFDELRRTNPKSHFTVGIRDDVSGTSLDYDDHFELEQADVVRAVFHGLGADGTVSANKNTIKIIGEDPAVHVQGYFVYDSKKSGSRTISHLRFGPRSIRSTYLIRSASFVACHQFQLLERVNVLESAAPGATFLLDSPFGPDEVWDRLPREVQQQIVEKRLRFHVIDASEVARETGMGGLTNTIMQTCFFALSGVLPRDAAIAKIKESIRRTYGRKGEEVVRRNFGAVDKALAALKEVTVPGMVTATRGMAPVVPSHAPAFVREVTAAMIAGTGDTLPVSALPIDGTYPSGTTRWEKRDIADFVPVWDPVQCVQCGNCSFVCPHAVIRTRLFHRDMLASAPEGFLSAPIATRGYPETLYTLQVHAQDCTGCGLCVEACPAGGDESGAPKAINLVAKSNDVVTHARSQMTFLETLPVTDRARVDFGTVRGVQFLEPLMEFSGACAGCGETPYLQLITQLFGDRMLVANATGCSSIFGGNLPTTPWSVNVEGRGPAWSNSLFEDNAEFGLGMRLATDRHMTQARHLVETLRAVIGEELADAVLASPQLTESEIRAQRERVALLRSRIADLDGDAARHLRVVADHLVRRSVWIVGGDGWAYDIGSGGLDHVLAAGRDVNVLVLDTEVYSNTGGQASKATPLGAVAKFANAGKHSEKKDLALQAIAYGNVYVARVAMGANPQQTLLALREAEAYPGPSLVLAYAHCIAHGIDMRKGLDQQQRIVRSGAWPLIRYNPALRASGERAFSLDSTRATLPLPAYADRELRFRMLATTNPAEVDELTRLAQEAVDRRWRTYEEMAGGA